jgi:hypothetical protein
VLRPAAAPCSVASNSPGVEAEMSEKEAGGERPHTAITQDGGVGDPIPSSEGYSQIYLTTRSN